MNNIVELKDLCKRYNGADALKSLSFQLKEGEILGLLGPNGAGKTTAIHIILGLLTPTSGEVKVFGLSPVEQRFQLLPKLNFSSAYVNLPYNLTAIQNLELYARLYNVKEAKKKIKELLEIFQISHLGRRRAGFLSSGEQTRLNLCKAFLNDPELLLLDEPTASLDPDMADLVKRVILKVQKERGMTILYTSHNMAEVDMVCDRILFIHRGEKKAEGTAAEVIQRFKTKNLEQVFIRIARSGDLLG
jgi:ABC-2 type transport system ATP-binding protein